MDVGEIEPLGAASPQQKETPDDTSSRPPLAPSEKNNVIPATRQPRIREVSSRYGSRISSIPVSTPTRSPSPGTARTSSLPVILQPKRAQSTERKRPTVLISRPSAPSSPPSLSSSSSSRLPNPSSPTSTRPTTPVHDTVKELTSQVHNSTSRSLSNRVPDGLWPSMRSLSSSFQSASSSLPASRIEKVAEDTSSNERTKAITNAAIERMRSPIRSRNISNQSENSRPLQNLNMKVIDQHRWPAMLGSRKNNLSRSLDLNDKVNKSTSSVATPRGVSPKKMDCISDSVSSGLQQSIIEVARLLSIDGTRRTECDIKSGTSISSQTSDRSSPTVQPSRTQSLPDSGPFQPLSPTRALKTPLSTYRGTLSPLRTRPASLSSTRPSSPTSTRSLSPYSTRPSSPSSTKPSSPSSTKPSSPSSTKPSSPSSTKPSSPSSTKPSSPSSTRPSSPSSSCGTSRAGFTYSVFNYIIDVQRGKKSINQDANQLRLLYNAHLQWRFINARADFTYKNQKMKMENLMFNFWNSISRLHHSVTVKKVNVQHLRQERQLNIMLQEQVSYLEHWLAMEREHCSCLSNVVNALRARALRLTISGGARVDVLAIRNALSSAVDIMHAMGSSICYLLPKVEDTESLAAELSLVAENEKYMLDECRSLLTAAARMQQLESSLVTHLMQLKQNAHKLD